MDEKTVKIIAHYERCGEFCSNLRQLQDLSDRWLNLIPHQYHDDAKLLIQEEDGMLSVEIFYFRPETSSERDSREYQESLQKSNQECRDRAILAKLKAKYGE